MPTTHRAKPTRTAPSTRGAPVSPSAWLKRKGYRTVNATEAKNRFGVILKTVATSEPVFIEKHDTVHAVVLDFDSYCALVNKAREPHEIELDTLRDEFEAMYARMQTAKSRKGVDALVRATPAQLNQVSAARLKSRR